MHTNTGSETIYVGPGSNEMTPPPWDIECIRTRGINIQKNMLGDVMNLQDITVQVFEIFFVNPLSSQDLGKWIAEGKIKYKNDIIPGLENAVSAIKTLFSGENKGKLIIKVSEEK